MLVTFGFGFSRGRGSADATLRNRTENGSAGNYLYYWFFLDQRAMRYTTGRIAAILRRRKCLQSLIWGIMWRVLRTSVCPDLCNGPPAVKLRFR